MADLFAHRKLVVVIENAVSKVQGPVVVESGTRKSQCFSAVRLLFSV